MKRLRLLLLQFIVTLFVLHGTTSAQERDEHLPPSATSISSDARYEILRATLTPKFDLIHLYLTMKLDKFTGRVVRLVEKEDGALTWEELARLDHKLDKVVNKSKVNYQIYSSGDFKSLYLLNINTGATWVLFVDKEKDTIYWNPIE